MYKFHFILQESNNLKIINSSENTISDEAKLFRVSFPIEFTENEILKGSEILIKFGVADLIKR